MESNVTFLDTSPGDFAQDAHTGYNGLCRRMKDPAQHKALFHRYETR